jgi:hypothetical protein
MPLRFAAIAAAALSLAAALAGCGEGSHRRPPEAVRLSLLGPADGTRTPSAEIRLSGRVTPSRARVLVLGHPVAVHGGRFTERIPLPPGTSVIDVLAGAPRAGAAMEAIRVTRFLLVEVPNVTGERPSKAAAQLTALGLRVRELGSSDPFGFLFPLPNQVCSTTPAAGASVDPGSTVAIAVGQFC